jgi:hypothetical protein
VAAARTYVRIIRRVLVAATALSREFDYDVATTRFGFANNYPKTVVATMISRDGVPFTVIRGARDAPAGQPRLVTQRFIMNQ